MKIAVIEPIGVEKKILDDLVKSFFPNDYEVVFFDNKPSDDKELIARVADSEVLMVVNHPISKNVIDSCPKLKFISVAFTGYDHVDLDACKEKGIQVSNAAGYSTDSVAELAVGMMIDLLRNVVEGDKRTRVGGTRAGIVGNQLKGKTVGVIGTGAIGTRVVELTNAFGCKVIAHSRTEKKELQGLEVEYLPLEDLLKQSDIVTIHTPLTDKTKDLIGQKELEIMKPSAFLIQTSRGGTVNEQALTKALNQGEIAGAGIDVFEIEPPLNPNNELMKAKNTLLTPHVAFATKEALSIRADIAFTNIKTWLSGNPQNRVA